MDVPEVEVLMPEVVAVGNGVEVAVVGEVEVVETESMEDLSAD